MHDQEAIWIEQARNGDTAAFCQLVSAYQVPVYNLSYRLLGNAAEAEDAAQETFVRMFTKLHTYQPDRRFSSWLLSIASHYCVDRLRVRRPGCVSLDDLPIEMEIRDDLPQPEADALRHEERDEVQRLVEALPVAYRVPLVLRYWHGLSYKEIADVLGLSVQAVKSRLHRARLWLVERQARGTAAVIPSAAGG